MKSQPPLASKKFNKNSTMIRKVELFCKMIINEKRLKPLKILKYYNIAKR